MSAIAVDKQRPVKRAVNYYTAVSEIAVYQQYELGSSRNCDSHASNKCVYTNSGAPPDKLVSSEQRLVQDRPLSHEVKGNGFWTRCPAKPAQT